jgi:Cu/Ag efflux pump CusA
MAIAFPDVLFYFQPADLVTQVLNFGVPTQIDVQIQGRDRENNAKVAALVQQKMAAVLGIVDAHVQQELKANRLLCFFARRKQRRRRVGEKIWRLQHAARTYGHTRR